jgi:hypothetical protein
VFKNPTRTKIITALFSLVLSFTFWLMMTSSETTTQDKTVMLEVVLPGEDLMVPERQFPESVTIRVEATGGQLKVIDSRRLLLRYDLSRERQGPGSIVFDPEAMAAALQFPWGARITRVPEPIDYTFHGYETKTVPVVLSLVDNYDDRLNVQGPIKIEPDKVTLRGPSNLMAAVRSVPVEVSRASASPGFRIEVKPNLAAIGPRVRLFPDVVFTATPDVQWKRAIRTFASPVELAPGLVVPGGRELAVSPETVAVTVSWPANYVNDSDPNGGVRTVVAPDMAELERAGGLRVDVGDILPNPGLVMVRINPSRVYVSLRPKPAAAPAPAAETPAGTTDADGSEAPADAAASRRPLH